MAHGWPDTENVVQLETVTQLTEEQRKEQENKAIETWLEYRTQLAVVKTNEMTARVTVTGMLFPNPKKGTQRFPLGQGYAIKLVHNLNYKLGDPEKVDPETEGKIKVSEQIFELQEKMDEIGPQARLLSDRLIKWNPELSVSEYQKLDVNDPIQRQLKDIVDSVLTVEPVAPQLTFEEPKGK